MAATGGNSAYRPAVRDVEPDSTSGPREPQRIGPNPTSSMTSRRPRSD